MIAHRIANAYRKWRLRPGVAFAAQLADQRAWKHSNAWLLGPEQNLLKFSVELNDRLLRADEGEDSALCLDVVVGHSMGADWRR